SLRISANFVFFEKVTDLRNDVEHYFSELAAPAMEQLLAESLIVVRAVSGSDFVFCFSSPARNQKQSLTPWHPTMGNPLQHEELPLRAAQVGQDCGQGHKPLRR